MAEAPDLAERRLRAASLRFDIVDPQSDAAIASMQAYFDELDRRFTGGFDPGDTLDADAPKFRAPDGAFVVAWSDSEAVACGGVQTLGDGVGEIKRMWVATPWRGLGVGRTMLDDLEERCRTLGHHTVRLDTNSALTEAIVMYEMARYRSIDRYNDNPFAKRWFEKSLTPGR